MAITNPEENTDYCDGTSGAKVEWQDPDRDIEEEEYEWDGIELDRQDMPFQLLKPATLGAFIETINLAPNGAETSVASLELNKYYTFVATGSISSGSVSVDACFVVNSAEETIEPSPGLTTSDEQFTDMFFKAADEGDVQYDPVQRQYAVGYIGNNAPITFNLAAGGTGTIQIEIFENDYRLVLFKSLESEDIILSDETRNKPYVNLNIACGGSCPTRSSFSCLCEGSGDRSCYYDDSDGNITKIFEGSGTP